MEVHLREIYVVAWGKKRTKKESKNAWNIGKRSPRCKTYEMETPDRDNEKCIDAVDMEQDMDA